MGYKIGIDFGTTNSTISYIDDSHGPEAFRYPGPTGYDYIPSCVAYDADGDIYIGRAAMDRAGDPESLFCNNLKMILPLSDEGRGKHRWPNSKSPEIVIADFFSQVLTSNIEGSSSFESQRGSIEGIVLSVPHVWAKDPDHAGRSRLQSIFADTMGLPLIQLISEPVAAAAYYAYRHQQEGGEAFSGNLLICDMGGGTFDVTLCKVTPGKVEELHNDGNGRIDLGKAGVQFDRRLIFNSLKQRGENIEENSPDFYEIYNRLQDAKVNDHPNITKRLIAAIGDTDLRKRAIIKAGKHGFNFDDIYESFTEIESGIGEVLTRFKKEIDAKGHNVDEVFFVGGFSEFYLVREGIKKFLDIEQKDIRFHHEASKEISRFAISFGAALIANDLISVEEKYEHTIGIEAKQISSDGKFKKIDIPIIIGGRKLGEYKDYHFAEPWLKVYHEHPDITLFIDPESKNRRIRGDLKEFAESLEIKLPNIHVPQNQWKVGMCINKSKVAYLIFKDRQGVLSEPYELGDILRKVFAGIYVHTEE